MARGRGLQRTRGGEGRAAGATAAGWRPSQQGYKKKMGYAASSLSSGSAKAQERYAGRIGKTSGYLSSKEQLCDPSLYSADTSFD